MIFAILFLAVSVSGCDWRLFWSDVKAVLKISGTADHHRIRHIGRQRSCENGSTAEKSLPGNPSGQRGTCVRKTIVSGKDKDTGMLRVMQIHLWTLPGGAYGRGKVRTTLASGTPVKILEEKEIKGMKYYRVKAEGGSPDEYGWVIETFITEAYVPVK